MKVIKTASGKKTIKLSKSEWETMGKTAGWMKKASESVEGLEQKSIEFGDGVRNHIENDGGKITDFRTKEVALANFMSDVTSEIGNRLYSVNPERLTAEIEKLKNLGENGQLTLQDLQPIFSHIQDLQSETASLKSFVKEVNLKKNTFGAKD